jgi:methionine-gamma-lyase
MNAPDPDPATSPGDRKKAPARRPLFEALPGWVGVSTRLVHGARRPDLNAGAVVAPIYQTTTFHYPADYSEARDTGSVYLYTRVDNPTREVAEELIRGLEGGERARLYGSGMGAISAALLSLLRPGEEVVALDTLYGGTLDLLGWMGPQFGIPVRWVSESHAREPESLVTPSTRLVFLESPTNPVLHVHDIQRWAEAAHRVGALLLVDNTFATPVNQRPLALGADLVLHSATKALGGHADLLAGAAVGADDLLRRIDPHDTLGSVLDPFAAFLLARGLRTLGLRVARQNENGRRVAEAVSGHRALERVHYPGLNDPEEEAIALRQMTGRGGMVALDLKGGLPVARRFLRALRLVHVASSLGSVESLASIPGETSHRHHSAEELARRGISPGLVRLSLGIEDPEDLVRDLTEALDHAT